MEGMPNHDPIPRFDQRLEDARRTAEAWLRYKKLMGWMAVAAVGAVLLALLYLKLAGGEIRLHMVIATIAGVGFSVLLGTGLMGLVYFSSHSGHDDSVGQGEDGDDFR
jgi:hypothetical protein